MVTVILLRHGQTATSQDHDLIEGCSDTSLTEVGRQQADRSAKKIRRHYEVAAIFSSPLPRAMQTGTIVASVLDINVQTSSFLQERNFGQLEGKTWSEVARVYGPSIREADRDGTYDYRRFGGGSADLIKKRLELLKEFLRFTYDDKTVVCITHGGIFRLLGFDVPWTASAEYKVVKW